MAERDERTESEEVKLSQMEAGCRSWVGWRRSESNSCEVVPQRRDSETSLPREQGGGIQSCDVGTELTPHTPPVYPTPTPSLSHTH